MEGTLTMAERPILFSSPMVRAILAGKKTETRRIVKPSNTERPCDCRGCKEHTQWMEGSLNESGHLEFPYRHDGKDYGHVKGFSRVKPGDLLWVKETHFVEITGDFPYAGEGLRLSQWTPELIKETIVHYRATTELNNPDDWRWRPSIFMPRWASRITLKVVSVHAERLQDITEEGAIAEGVRGPAETPLCIDDCRTAFGRYRELWEEINGEGSWDSNPWAWVIKFEVVKS